MGYEKQNDKDYWLNWVKEIRKQNKGFWTKSYFNDHLTLYKHMRWFEIQFYIGRDPAEKYDWLICINLAFWGMEVSWNGRKNK